MAVSSQDPIFPRADEALTQEILDLVKQASDLKLVKKGQHEAKKSVTSGQSQLVVIAADTDPIPMAGGIPNYCVGEDVPYIWVPSKADLGIACGIKKGAMVASINSSDSSPIAPQVKQLRQKIEQLWGP